MFTHEKQEADILLRGSKEANDGHDYSEAANHNQVH